MRLHIYQGLDGEVVPNYITHVIVDEKVTIIKRMAFYIRNQLVSVIMGDNVKVIDEYAFYGCLHLASVVMGDSVKTIGDKAFYYCHTLKFIRLSKTLESIGELAFFACHSMEAQFLPPTVNSIGMAAYMACRSLKLLILPNAIELNNVGEGIIKQSALLRIAETAGEEYEKIDGHITDESNRRVHNWLIHHMDESPFHKLCYDPSINTQKINNYYNEVGHDFAFSTERMIHGLTPLHMLSLNPYAPADSITAVLGLNMEAIFYSDNQEKTPLDYARDYNLGGLVGIIAGLCNHRNSSIPDEADVFHTNAM